MTDWASDFNPETETAALQRMIEARSSGYFSPTRFHLNVTAKDGRRLSLSFIFPGLPSGHDTFQAARWAQQVMNGETPDTGTVRLDIQEIGE